MACNFTLERTFFKSILVDFSRRVRSAVVKSTSGCFFFIDGIALTFVLEDMIIEKKENNSYWNQVKSRRMVYRLNWCSLKLKSYIKCGFYHSVVLLICIWFCFLLTHFTFCFRFIFFTK